ncbi:MAG: outer membrane protein assembly factor BamA [Victivallales bacterium]|nr:outer membrane protein assembly factor BamA [Victivallales bacterium]
MKLKRNLMVLWAFLCCLALTAVELGEIRVQSKSSGVPMSVLEQIVSYTVVSKVGDEFKANVVSEDIGRLVKSGKFDDVRITTDVAKDGKVILTFILKPKPVVGDIYIKGANIYKPKKLVTLLKLEPGQILDEKILAADREALLQKYRNAGYYGTTVTSTRSEEKDGKVDVSYVIREETRYKLKQVYFENNTAFDLGKLRSEIVTRRQWWRYILRLGNYYNEQNLALDKDRLKHLYGTRGYLDFAVTEVKQEPIEDGKWIKVTFVLEEGRQYKVGKITVEGNERFKEEDLLKLATTKEGDLYDVDRESADTEAMRGEYERLGYMDLRFYPVHEKNKEKCIVNVHYKVTEGGISNIRNVVITGNEITRDEVIRRELVIGPGDLGDMGKVRASKQRLMNLGYFETVEMLPVATDEPALKDLKIDLKEKATGQISLGAGFSTEDSAIAFIEFTETNFDLSRIFNWPPKGAGQRFRVRTQVGDDVLNASISLTEPWFLDRRLELTTDLFWRERFEDEYDQRNVGGGQTLSWPVSFRIPGFKHIENWRFGVGYRVEHVKISDVDTHNPIYAMTNGDFVKGHILADEEGTYWANRMFVRMTRDTRNAFNYPTKGSKFIVQGEYVTEAFGSYDSYGRYSINWTNYTPFIRDLVLKLDAGYSTSDGDEMAIFDRYFAGGIGTVRGFKRRDVAPVDCYKDPLGGNSMFTGTVEIIKPIKDFMFVSTFMDAGNVWWDECDFGKLNYSIGLGVQFRALPISIYYGYPISTAYDHLDGKSGRIHFNIGISY